LEHIKSNQVGQSSRQSYERIQAGIFANFKGSAPQVSTYLKSLGEDDLGLICRSITKDSESVGLDLARKWLERDTAKMPWSSSGWQKLRSHLPVLRVRLGATGQKDK